MKELVRQYIFDFLENKKDMKFNLNNYQIYLGYGDIIKLRIYSEWNLITTYDFLEEDENKMYNFIFSTTK